MSRILIVDDHPDLHQLLSMELGDYGYNVTRVNDEESLRNQIRESKPDVVLLEPFTKGYKGDVVLSHIKSEYPMLPVIVVTTRDEYRDDPRLSAADGYIVKNIQTVANLKQVISRFRGRASAAPDTLEIARNN